MGGDPLNSASKSVGQMWFSVALTCSFFCGLENILEPTNELFSNYKLNWAQLPFLFCNYFSGG